MTVNELQANISKGDIEHLYLFAGSEIGEKNNIINLIIQKLSLSGSVAVTKEYYYIGDEFKISDFFDNIDTLSLFVSKRLIFLKNIENINNTTINHLENLIIPKIVLSNVFEEKILSKALNLKKDKDLLNFYIKKTNSYNLKGDLKSSDKKSLVNLFYEIDFSNIDSNIYIIMLNETSDKIPSELTDILSSRQNIIFWEMFENQKHNWIKNEFRKYNVSIEEAAINYIVEMVDNNKQSFEDEIQRIIASYFNLWKDDNLNRRIKKGELEELLYHSKDESGYTLYSALLNKNIEKALEILNITFYSNIDLISLVNSLQWSHRRFLKAIYLSQIEHLNYEEIYKKVDITNIRAKEEIVKGIKNYKYLDVAKLYNKILELDYFMRAYSDDLKYVKLQLFIIDFVYVENREFFLQSGTKDSVGYFL